MSSRDIAVRQRALELAIDAERALTVPYEQRMTIPERAQVYLDFLLARRKGDNEGSSKS